MDINGDLQQYAEDLTTGVSRSVEKNGQNGQLATATTTTNGAVKQQGLHNQQDDLAIAQNGGISSSDEDDMDRDQDDSDDDGMDKISSSPSIEDGACVPNARMLPAWPRRVDSLPSSHIKSSPTNECATSSTGPNPEEDDKQGSRSSSRCSTPDERCELVQSRNISGTSGSSDGADEDGSGCIDESGSIYATDVERSSVDRRDQDVHWDAEEGEVLEDVEVGNVQS